MNLRSGAFFGVWLLTVPFQVAAVQPVITLTGEAVEASGMTPGGKVVWFGVAREISEHTATIKRRERIATDDDKNGAVRLDLGRPVPFQSIWVAVDLATGASAVAVPKGYPLRLLELPGNSAGRGGGGQPDWVEDGRGFVEILLVRPGEGGRAWGATVGDGGEVDDDGAYDGRLVASLARLRAVGSSSLSAPERFSPRDVLVIIDPNRMEVGVRQLVEVPR